MDPASVSARRWLARAAAGAGRRAYVLRVGVVHGELQAVSRKIRHQVKTAGPVLTSVPGCESYAVFAVSIAEALVSIANGREEPGLYTMLPSPGVAWPDLHIWYCQRTGVTPRMEVLRPDPPGTGAVAGVTAPLRRLVFSGKDVIASYIGGLFPEAENRLRAVYHARNAASEIAAGRRASQYRPYGNNHSVFPGRRFQNLSESLSATDAYSARIWETLDRGLPERRGAGTRRQ